MLVSTTIRTINDDDDTQKLDQPEFGIAYHVSMGLWMHIIYTWNLVQKLGTEEKNANLAPNRISLELLPHLGFICS